MLIRSPGILGQLVAAPAAGKWVASDSL